MYNFENKVVAITGAARGLGADMSKRFFEEGAIVAMLGRNLETTEARAREIDPEGKQCFAFLCEVTDEESVKAAFAQVHEKLGKVDVLINNAGFTKDGMFHKMTTEQFDDVIKCHVYGAYYCTRQVIEGMRERGYGRIINFASTSAFGNMGQANYAAGKSALLGFTSTLALENGRKGITANVIAPGFCDTDIIKTVPEKVMDGILAGIPMGRVGRPEEVSALAAFLASDESSYITGQCIKVSGGKY